MTTLEINEQDIPHFEGYISALADDLEYLEEFSPRQVMTKFIMELDLCDHETTNPFVPSQLPFQQVYALIKEVTALLDAYHLDPDEENFAGYPDTARRIEIAREIFPHIVAALLPQAIQQDSEEKKQVAFSVEFLIGGYATLGVDDLNEAHQSIKEFFLDALHSKDPLMIAPITVTHSDVQVYQIEQSE